MCNKDLNWTFPTLKKNLNKLDLSDLEHNNGGLESSLRNYLSTLTTQASYADSKPLTTGERRGYKPVQLQCSILGHLVTGGVIHAQGSSYLLYWLS